jgi:Fe(3+) dicitrate transport protein
VDLAAAGGSGSGDLYNGGAARTGGLEFEFFYDFLHQSGSSLRLPVSIAYTWTRAEFLNDFESDFEPWGTVSKGDELPFIPDHMLSLSVTLENQHFNINLNNRYNGAMRTVAGQDALNPQNSIDAYFITDISANVNISRNIAISGALLNLFNSEYSVSNRPAGLRPGIPRAFRLGIKAGL